MPVSFDQLRVGVEYERTFLADLWGYQGVQAISRGVITPAKTPFIILFVTREKQSTMTQYIDYISDHVLHWQGEERHGADHRIVEAAQNGDQIQLFYRDVHHSSFVYYGPIQLIRHTLRTNVPSEFVFVLAGCLGGDVLEDIASHEADFTALSETEQTAIRKSRIGQGLFRERVIALWGGCSVTGLINPALLRASHIKPWRECSNEERLDPANGLLLLPTLDHLFDTGWITFAPNGRIEISPGLSAEERTTLGVDPGMALRAVPTGVHKYLRYHRGKVFTGV